MESLAAVLLAPPDIAVSWERF